VRDWRSWLPTWRRGEAGISEAATAIFVLPLLALLIFMLIETGMNIRYRLLVDNIVQTAVRGVALDGGDCNPRVGCRSGSQRWSSIATTQLRQLCNDSGRSRTPCGSVSVTCRPVTAPQVGTPVWCETTFDYRPITGMASNPVTSLGFSALLNAPIKVRVESAAGVGVD